MKYGGGYDSMITHIAKLESVSEYKTIEFKTLAEAKKVVKNYDIVLEKMGVKFTGPKKEMRKGGIEVLVVRPHLERGLSLQEQITQGSNNMPIDVPIDSVFERIYAIVRKGLSDFKTIPTYAGKAKICEGGGWYSNGSKYIIGDTCFEY